LWIAVLRPTANRTTFNIPDPEAAKKFHLKKTTTNKGQNYRVKKY
jgi:hypothetical protein